MTFSHETIFWTETRLFLSSSLTAICSLYPEFLHKNLDEVDHGMIHQLHQLNLIILKNNHNSHKAQWFKPHFINK